MTQPLVLRILMVEDNPGDVFLLRTALTRSGMRFELRVIENGEQAQEAIEKLRAGGDPLPDVILLDLNLPRCGGVDALRAIRASSDLATVPVAIYTSSNSAHDRGVTAQLGVRHYILKPDRLADLTRIVATITEFGHARASGERGTAA